VHHKEIIVQPLSLAYVGFGGLPVGRALRENVAWYGDAELIPHFIGILAAGATDITVSWGDATAYDISADRKAIAREAERSVRRMTSAALRAGPPNRAMAQPAPDDTATAAIA
jgi:1-acyl-sn-glycerol-3-phosphate acyltransferase